MSEVRAFRYTSFLVLWARDALVSVVDLPLAYVRRRDLRRMSRMEVSMNRMVRVYLVEVHRKPSVYSKP